MTDAPPVTAGRRRRDWRVSSFLAAESASAIGTWATIVAIWGYAAFEYDASAGEVAAFGVAFSLPPVVLSPITGTAIDRYGPKAVLAFAKVVGVLASLSLLLADSFLALAALSLVHGAGAAFALPALQAMPPRIVEAAALARTNALVALVDELAIVLGPVAAGVSIAWFGFRGAFVFDAVTYGLGLVVLPLVVVRPIESEAGAPPRTIRDAFEGWRIVARTPILRYTVSAIAAANLLYGAALLAEPLYVRDVLERSPSTFAALQTAFGVCLVASGLAIAKLEDRVTAFGWVALGTAASGASAAVYLGTGSIVVAFIGVGLWGFCTALLSGPTRTLLQRHSDEAAHGRVLATDHVSASIAQLVGIGLTGVLVANFGVPTSLAALGTLVVVVAGMLQGAHVRELRRSQGSTLAA